MMNQIMKQNRRNAENINLVSNKQTYPKCGQFKLFNLLHRKKEETKSHYE